MKELLAKQDPDIEHVRAVARGDKRAARVLIDAHGDRLMAVAYRMLGDRAAAEDIVQEAFIKMWRHAKNWQEDQALFSTWLHRVTMNLCYDRLRKASTRYEHSAGDTLPEMVDEHEDAACKIERHEEAQALRASLERLPVRQKMAIILCHFEERTNAEAGEIMEISVQAVESLLSRGRRALKADLGLQQSLADEAEREVQNG